MISYGAVVGYGRGTDFLNVFYGLAMLFIIGGLYGFTGGGLLALTLMDSDKARIKWHQLVVEMVAFGILTYALLIGQLEWLMTPPRSEMWAVCFGASIAFAWHVIRLGHRAVLRVAVWSALGAGFGFAFGNVLQVLGGTLAVPLNLWNVMEYSIGFCGGAGMAYAVFTTSWPVMEPVQTRNSHLVPLILLMIFVPFVVWDQSFTTEKLNALRERGGSEHWILAVQYIAILSIMAMAAIAFVQAKRHDRINASDSSTIRLFFVLYLGVFTLLSFLVTGVTIHPVEQYLYVANIIIFLVFVGKSEVSFSGSPERQGLQFAAFASIVVVLAISAMVMIQSHGELKGNQVRFQQQKTGH
jgi:hypothetical protein